MYLETLVVIDKQLSEGPNIWYLQRESRRQSWILVCIYNDFPYAFSLCSGIDFIDDPSPNTPLEPGYVSPEIITCPQNPKSLTGLYIK